MTPGLRLGHGNHLCGPIPWCLSQGIISVYLFTKSFKSFMLKTVVSSLNFWQCKACQDFIVFVRKEFLNECMSEIGVMIWFLSYDLAHNFLSLLRRKNEMGEGRASESAIAILSMDFQHELFQYKAHTQNLEITASHCVPPDDSDKWTHFRMGANICVSRSCRDDNEKVHSKWWMVRCGSMSPLLQRWIV